MGNPAEKTIRNPNLKRLLFKVQTGVNGKIYFTAEFCLDGEKSVNLYNIVCIVAFAEERYANLDPSG